MIDKSSFSWPGNCRAAVSLTYDDGRNCHLSTVIPYLDECKLHGTFYVTVAGPFLEQWRRWKEAAGKGHEIGNHTLFHPCRNERDERSSWLHHAYNLCDYTEQRFSDEVRVANWILAQVDGSAERTYAATCFNTTIGRGNNTTSLEPVFARHFMAARGGYTDAPVDISNVNYNNIKTVPVDGSNVDDIAGTIERTVTDGAWLVLTMHSVDDTIKGKVGEPAEHRRLLSYLAGNRERIWTAPFLHVVKHLRGFEL